VRARHEEAAHLLVERVQVEEAAARTSVLGRIGGGEPTPCGHLLPQVGRVAEPAALYVAYDVGRALLGEERVGFGLDEALVGFEREVDGHGGLGLSREAEPTRRDDHALHL
jgi:hypothetical protein